MRTASYEASVERNYIDLYRRIGGLKGDLAIIRATIRANLEHVEEGWPRGALAQCIERIDRALAEKEI